MPTKILSLRGILPLRLMLEHLDSDADDSLLRVNPTLKVIHAPKNSLNSAERNLYPPLIRRDVLASQLIKLSHEYSQLQEELGSLEVEVLSMEYVRLC